MGRCLTIYKPFIIIYLEVKKMRTIFSLLSIAKDPENPYTGKKCNKCGGEIFKNPHSAKGVPLYQCNKGTDGFSEEEFKALKGPP